MRPSYSAAEGYPWAPVANLSSLSQLNPPFVSLATAETDCESPISFARRRIAENEGSSLFLLSFQARS